MSDKNPVHTSKPHGINWDDDDVATKEQIIHNLLVFCDDGENMT